MSADNEVALYLINECNAVYLFTNLLLSLSSNGIEEINIQKRLEVYLLASYLYYKILNKFHFVISIKNYIIFTTILNKSCSHKKSRQSQIGINLKFIKNKNYF